MNLSRPLSLLAASLVALTCLVPSSVQAQKKPGYSVVRLAFPGAVARTTEAFKFNDRANVVGKYRDVGDLPCGFHYDRATGAYTSLGVMTSAEGINQQDALVGFDELFGCGLYWSSPAAAPKLLPPLSGHTHSRAHAINNSGIIVGASYIPEDPPVTPGYRAIVAWYVNAGTVSAPVELPFLTGDLVGRAFDLTEAVAGITTVVGISQPGLWDPMPLSWNVAVGESRLVVTGPALFAGNYFLAEARGVNKFGDAVGMVAWAEGSGAAPFVRPIGDSMIPLPMLPKASTGHATSINDAGQIVGFQIIFQKGQGALQRAVLWTSSSAVVDLNSQVSLGSSEKLEYAFDINSRGDILARINGNTPCLLIAK